MLRIGDVLEELYNGCFLGRIVLLGSGQESLDGGDKTAFALAAFVGRVQSNFAVVSEKNAVNGIVFLVEVGNPPRTVQIDGGSRASQWPFTSPAPAEMAPSKV